MIKLYDYPKSSAAYRVRIACNLKGVAYESIEVNLLNQDQQTEEYLRINPSGLVPCLIAEDGTVLSQSLAILKYLDQAFPNPPIFPRDPIGESLVWEMVLIIGCDIHPLNNLRVLQYIQKNLDANEQEKSDWYSTWIQRGFSGLEALTKKSPGVFCFGNSVTAADILLAPQMFNARRFNVDLEHFPNLVEIDRKLLKIAAFASAAPDA
ncbi:MAG: maleylacetoacetate isomerase [Pseudomonadota bacterium]